MEKIPLTRFVDFVVASGTTRLTRVREIKNQLEPGYSKWRDYYKEIRDAIVASHDTPPKRKALEQAVAAAARLDHSKGDNYAEVARQYERYRKTVADARRLARRSEWAYRDLTVVVNPELRVDVKGVRYWVKLYFKADALTKNKSAVALQLMWESLSPKRAKVAVLDVRRAKLYSRSDDARDLNALLIGDALAFQEMWKRI